MDIARFNFLTAITEEQLHRINLLKSVREEIAVRSLCCWIPKAGDPVPALWPVTESTRLKGYHIPTTDKVAEAIITRDIRDSMEDLSVGNRILIDDGLFELQVQELDAEGYHLYRGQRRRAGAEKRKESLCRTSA